MGSFRQSHFYSVFSKRVKTCPNKSEYGGYIAFKLLFWQDWDGGGKCQKDKRKNEGE